MSKPNCYECEYRGLIPGDAHSCCKHPSFKDALSDPLLSLLGIFASVGRVEPIRGIGDGITVTGNPHGIRSGWFNHPFNFDPTWLESCTGFQQKGDNTDEKEVSASS